MQSLYSYIASPTPCSYLPDRLWSLEYEYVAEMSPAEYLQRMLEGWRRFGTMLFRPACESCQECRPLRVLVNQFQPSRTQKRIRKTNEGNIELQIGNPFFSRNKISLYDRFHAFQRDNKGWPHHPPNDVNGYVQSFVQQPFPVEEWCYYIHGKLVGVGYVDALPPVPKVAEPSESSGRRPLAMAGEEPLAGGLSAIYFFYDPEERQRSLGAWNILCLIEEARRRKLPHVYLGYYVEGCGSMAYKMNFVPNQIREPTGNWRDYRVDHG